MDCQHDEIVCLNEYEQIRKYRCIACGEVMMCACDEAFAGRFCQQGIHEGTELDTAITIKVTIGFQPGICRVCRGFPAESHPMAVIWGRTSKIKRYYWRELYRRETEIFADWKASAAAEVTSAEEHHAYEEASGQALQEIKLLHQTSPTYSYSEESQADLIDRCNVEVVRLDATYVRNANVRRAQVLSGNEHVTVEEFVSRYYREQGYATLFVESVPFHVLFGVYMWTLIQDFGDKRSRIVGFGDRVAFEEGRRGQDIFCYKPEDFGTSGYGKRRELAIDRHFSEMLEPFDLERLFEHSLAHSIKLRQYLWAHREKDIDTARKIVEILPKAAVLHILRYLVDSYWQRYLGWPDLLVYRNEDIFFTEVKSSQDKLSDDQKRWISDNFEQRMLPFKLLKVHRRR